MQLNLDIRCINKENMEKLLPDLFSLENNWTAIGEKAWKKENFQLDLPGKWELSISAFHEGKIRGYAICSIEKDAAKLNKIVVDNPYRRIGIATKLWTEFLKKCRERNLNKIEFKVFVENEPAIRFYRKKGCLFYGTDLGKDDRLRYLCRYVFKTSGRINHSKPTIDDQDTASVVNALKNGGISNGNVVNKFNHAVSSYIGKKYGIAVSNGTSALYLTLKVLGVKKGDGVILPSYICSSVLSAVESCGANSIIADINKDDYNISFEDAKRRITDKTKAIIIAHMFGKPVKDLKSFLSLNIPIIEDCALSIGAEHQGKKIGSFGEASIFSFYATKMMTTGVGGMILTDDKDTIERLDNLTKYDNREKWGENFNFKMSDMQAALGLSQLNKLDSFIKRRKEIARNYTKMFKDASIDFSLPNEKENVFFRYIIEHPGKEPFMENIQKRGVDIAKPIYKPLHSYCNLPDEQFPNTSKAYKNAVSIPIFPSLTDSEVEGIASILINWRYEK